MAIHLGSEARNVLQAAAFQFLDYPLYVLVDMLRNDPPP